MEEEVTVNFSDGVKINLPKNKMAELVLAMGNGSTVFKLLTESRDIFCVLNPQQITSIFSK